MRLFIAVNFNDNTKNKLLTLRDELRSNSTRGNFTLPENIHLTLVFLGECDVKQTESIKSVINMTSFKPFDLIIERLGRFKRGSDDIWWAGVKEDTILLDLQQSLTTELCAKGFQPDNRKYNPHITLGREIVTEVSPKKVEPFGETVTKIELMKSERVNGKLTYTAIFVKNI